jgi:preprotein translocase subunit SecG
MVFWSVAPALMPMNSPELPDSIGRLAHNLGANGGYPYASVRWKDLPGFEQFLTRGRNFVALTLSILLVITSVLMVLLVLLHKGKGSGLSDLFGGGVSSSYGGSSVVEKNLDRITIVVGGLWFAGVIALSLVLKN